MACPLLPSREAMLLNSCMEPRGVRPARRCCKRLAAVALGARAARRLLAVWLGSDASCSTAKAADAKRDYNRVQEL